MSPTGIALLLLLPLVLVSTTRRLNVIDLELVVDGGRLAECSREKE